MNDQMKKTALFDYHNSNSKNIISFSGYALPVFYKSILDEHHAVRKSAGLFDVSHMGQIIVSGASAEKFIQTVTTNDVSKIRPGQAQYSAICNNDGCIIDDIIVYKLRKGFMLVVNASSIEKKYDWLKSKLFDGVSIENKSSDFSMIAVQGPKSLDIMNEIFGEKIQKLKFFRFDFFDFNKKRFLISKSGFFSPVSVTLNPIIIISGPNSSISFLIFPVTIFSSQYLAILFLNSL